MAHPVYAPASGKVDRVGKNCQPDGGYLGKYVQSRSEEKLRADQSKRWTKNDICRNDAHERCDSE